MSFSTRHAVESSSSSSPPQCRQFTFSEIEVATRNFDESLVIGRGGFGRVYRGTITHGNIQLDAAIKRLESGSSQGAVEFWAEIETLSNLRHCHLVSLIGYCSDGQEKILVYEYMPNGTLADRLHKHRAPLTWVRRLKICIGAARGLDYLHTGTGIQHGVIHRDFKSTNILLDKNWAAKISDFGLSKIGPTNQSLTYVNTSVKGTIGYIDPDYYQTGRLTRKSDVYAFGVVLFEVLCGKQAIDRSIDEEQWGLAPWAQDSIKEGRLKEIVDFCLRGVISSKCLKKFSLIAGRCLHSHPKQRPTMAEVVVDLESILALQEKADSTMRFKLFGIRGSSIQENFVDITSSKSVDRYLYTIGGEDQIVHRFDFNTILYATESFSEANKISGIRYHEWPMYKGRLQNGQDITIAQCSCPDGYKFDECVNEASILLKLEHENLIQLLGYCIRKTELYLVFDFAPYATLNSLIFDPMCNLLDWNKRCKIILGVASALVYLHHHAPIRIIHRDVTPFNILLDESFHPKLLKFGDAVAVEDVPVDFDYELHGTTGYIAPEYLFAGRLSSKADVYSFGMLVFVIVTGQRPIEFFVHVNVYRNWLEGTILDIIDPRVDVDPVLVTKYMEIALLCTQIDATVRPTMEEVVDMLLGTVSPTLPVSKMRARMNSDSNKYEGSDTGEVEEPADLDGNEYEGSDTGEVEELILELGPR